MFPSLMLIEFVSNLGSLSWLVANTQFQQLLYSEPAARWCSRLLDLSRTLHSVQMKNAHSSQSDCKEQNVSVCLLLWGCCCQKVIHNLPPVDASRSRQSPRCPILLLLIVWTVVQAPTRNLWIKDSASQHRCTR